MHGAVDLDLHVTMNLCVNIPPPRLQTNNVVMSGSYSDLGSHVSACGSL